MPEEASVTMQVEQSGPWTRLCRVDDLISVQRSCSFGVPEWFTLASTLAFKKEVLMLTFSREQATRIRDALTMLLEHADDSTVTDRE